MQEKKAFTVGLDNSGGYQSLLKKDGELLTFGMHSGRVWLEAGGQCGVHNTNDKEEMLVFLGGRGVAKIKGQDDMKVGAGKVAYIPPKTEHNIVNTGDEPLVYVFCVSPVKYP